MRVPSTELHLRGVFSKLRKKISFKQRRRGEAVRTALLNRRTVNNFEPHKRVKEEIVQRAVQAAIYAPCHKMTEPWRFIHLGQETIAQIATLNAAVIAKKDPVKGAKKKKRWAEIPGWCVVTCAKSSTGDDALLLREREDYAATCCAVQNLMLSFWADGVGTKWTTGDITRTPEFADLCGVEMTTEDVVGCIWYGYASGGLDSVPAPKRRRSLEDVTSYRP